MTKLKTFLEVYRPVPKGEQNFVDKHITIKHKDRNGNGDDVFKATNIKTVEREKEHHGHSSGNDEKVYEGVEELDEISKKTLGSYIKKASNEVLGKSYSAGYGHSIDPGDDRSNKKLETAAKRTVGINVAASKLSGHGYTKVEAQDYHKMKSGKSLTKEDVINRTLEKYMPEINEYEPLSEEEKLLEKLEGLSESHIFMILDLYNSLSEENKPKIFDVVETKEGINSLIDLAIEESKGE